MIDKGEDYPPRGMRPAHEIPADIRAPEHEHAIFLCCLRELIAEVKEYAPEQLGASDEMVEVFYELLSIHVEESWESYNKDIVAPEKN